MKYEWLHSQKVTNFNVEAKETRENALSVEKDNEKRRSKNMDSYKERVRPLKKKNKSKERAQDERDRFNDRVAVSEVNANNSMLELMHLLTKKNSLTNEQAPSPPLPQQEEVKPPEGIVISD